MAPASAQTPTNSPSCFSPAYRAAVHVTANGNTAAGGDARNALHRGNHASFGSQVDFPLPNNLLASHDVVPCCISRAVHQQQAHACPHPRAPD